MKSLLKRLVETESPTSDNAAVDRIDTILANEACCLDADFELVPIIDAGKHLITRWGGKGGILLMCHMDTVFSTGTLTKMPN